SPVHLRLAARAAESLHLVDGHTGDPDLPQAILHLFQLEWLDDRFDFFHGFVSLIRLRLTRRLVVVIPRLTMVRLVETGLFVLDGRTQADGGLDDHRDYDRTDDGERQGDADGLVLLQQQAVEHEPR